MQDALAVYFNGEKYAGLLLASLAVVVLTASGILWRAGTPLRPFSMVLGILALAEVALGVGLFLRTGPQVRQLEAQLRSEPPHYYASEATRMRRVQRNFVVVEYVEWRSSSPPRLLGCPSRLDRYSAAWPSVFSYTRPFSSRSICSQSAEGPTTYRHSPRLGVPGCPVTVEPGL